MKKQYIQPSLEVFKLNMQQGLLRSSLDATVEGEQGNEDALAPDMPDDIFDLSF